MGRTNKHQTHHQDTHKEITISDRISSNFFCGSPLTRKFPSMGMTLSTLAPSKLAGLGWVMNTSP